MNIYTKSCLDAIKILEGLNRNEFQAWAQEEIDLMLKIARGPDGPNYAERMRASKVIDRPFFGWVFV
jgi:hypothetical protein